MSTKFNLLVILMCVLICTSKHIPLKHKCLDYCHVKIKHIYLTEGLETTLFCLISVGYHLE